MSQDHSQRDPHIDALRGLAIASMVASHLASDLLPSPHPLWLRAFGSVAAPLFLTLSGMLMAQTMAHKRHSFRHYLSRGGMILVLAACVDLLVWMQYPFVSFDVLYLIGVAVPMSMLFARVAPAWQAAGLALFLCVSVVLRQTFGYPEEVTTIAISESPAAWFASLPQIAHQFLISGWFPLFPWMFFCGLGVCLFQWRKGIGRKWQVKQLWAATCFLVLGLFLGWVAPEAARERGGYTELFYPPTVAFVLVASGGVLLLFHIFRWKWLGCWQPLILLGKCPLLLYLVHLVVIHWGIRQVYPEVTLPFYFVLYGGLLAALVGLAAAVEEFKNRSTIKLPLLARLLVGA